MNIRGYSLFLACIAGAWILGACHTERDGEALIVLTSADNPPFESYDTASESFVGFDIELAQNIAQVLKKKLVIRDMQFDFLLPALKTGRGDVVIAGLSPSPARSMIVDFSDPYEVAPIYIVTPKQSKYNGTTLEGMRMGAQQGSTFEDYLKISQKKAATAADKNGDAFLTIHALPKLGDVIQELKNGRIDGALMEKKTAEAYAEGGHLQIFPLAGAASTLTIATRKNSYCSIKINEALSLLRRNGTLDRLKQKWLL